MLGILEKSPRPRSFWPRRLNEQWSVAMESTSPASTAPRSARTSDGLRKGGLITYLAPAKLSSPHSR